jgi:hypothetical protein
MMMMLGAAVLGPVGWAHADTLHVALSGTDSSTCGAPGAPCQHLDYAVNKAASGDAIHVAGGKQVFANVPNACGSVPIQSVVCVIDKSVTIQGGYAAGTWVFDPAANVTVIDGQNAVRGVFVLSQGSPSVRLTMANITIQNARVPGTPSDSDSAFGGGMEVTGAAVTLDSVTFQDNQAVGNNTGSGAGGAGAGSALSIRSSLGGVSLLSNVLFQNNISTGGQGPSRGGVAFGALFVFSSTVNIDNSRFISNTAQGGSSAGSGDLGSTRADALGGAVGVEGGATVSLSRVTATGNQALGGTGTQFGGGAFGGAVFVEGSTATIADSLFQSNVARGGASTSGGFAGGGGILSFNANVSIDRTRILANRVTSGNSSPSQPVGNVAGGGLYLWRNNPATSLPTLQVTNTVIADNLAELGQGTTPSGGGGGVFVQGLTADLTHVTLARNQLGAGLVVGQALALVDAPGVSTTTVNLKYSAVTDHAGSPSGATALVVLQTNTLNLNNGAFSGNTHNINDNNNPVPPGTITGLASMTTVGPPGFVSPGPPFYDYHLNTGSPLRDAANGSTMQVDMDGGSRVDGRPDIGADEYRTLRSGDFNGDTKADILWRHSSGDVAIWLMNGTSVVSSAVVGNVSLDWTIAGVGDFNGDGKTDLLWRHTSGLLAVWLMNGTTIVGTGMLGSVGTDWTIAGVGDFNGDGRADILWRHTSGTVAVWLLNGTTVVGSGVPGSVGTDWTIAGVGDFNGDTKADILWRHTSGTVAIWLLNGTSFAGSGVVGNPGTDWAISGVGDFNGDGRADILWRHTSGTVAVWLMNGTSVLTTGTLGSVGSDWGIAGAGDFDGSGKADILWQNTSGLIYEWLLNGTSIVATGSPGSVGSGWQIK